MTLPDSSVLLVPQFEGAAILYTLPDLLAAFVKSLSGGTAAAPLDASGAGLALIHLI